MPAPGTTAASPGATTELARDLKLFDVTMVGVGAMIGAGIFALTGIAAGRAGPGLILAFAFNGLLTLCTAMVYAEIGSAIPGAGGGYLWSKFGLPGPGAFLAGWMDWLAHAVAGSLYAVVFGAYVVWGAQTILHLGTPPTGAEHGDMGTLFGVDATWIAKGLTLLVCLAFVYVNYRGSAETGKAGNIITVSKICTIGLFIAFGLVALARGGGPGATASLGEKFSPFLPQGVDGVLIAMGLTFIAFEGYEIIVQAGEEVVEPRRNIPRAVFWSLAIVIPIYLLVAIVCLGAMNVPIELLVPTGPFRPEETWRYLAALGETGVAEAANQFMPWGTGAVLLVLGAVLSTMSALNATTYSSTRVSFAMGRDRNLPAFMATISPRTRTPVAALLASGALITFVAVWLDAERVAAATCVMFLLVFAGVNVAAITIRRKYGSRLKYGYMMPLFPLVPVVAIVGQLGVAVFLFVHEPMSLYITAAWIAVGLVVYYTWSRNQEHELKATPVVFEQRPVVADAKRRVLVPIANPANAGPLIDLAAKLARPREASLVVLHVVAVPEQLPYYATGRFVREARGVVDTAMTEALGTDVPAEGLVRVARHPARSIIDTLIDRKCDMLVMGWTGPKQSRQGLGLSSRRPLIGSQIDHVLLHADADTIVIRGSIPASPARVVVPVANPRQGRFAVEVAEAVAGPSTVIELVHVLRDEAAAEARGAAVMGEIFGEAGLEAASPRRGLPVRLRAMGATDVVAAVVEAAEGADLVITGASAETWLHRHAFTHFHYELARRYDGPMLLVKLRTGLAKFASQRTIEFFRSSEPAH
ncbi:MAG: amino acid permease [Planctomycetota bacterium]|jgi:amino acid transporter